MLHDLGWRDLKDRWQDLRLALPYKIVTGHVAVNPDQIGLLAADNGTRANHGTNSGQYGHLHVGCAAHLLSKQSMIGTRSLLLLSSMRLQLPSRLRWPVWRLSHVACRNPPSPMSECQHDTPQGCLPSILEDEKK